MRHDAAARLILLRQISPEQLLEFFLAWTGRRSRGGSFAADGFDGFWTGFGDQENGAAFESESAAQFAFEIAFIRRGEKFMAIDEEKEGGRSALDLSGVEKSQEMAGRAD